MSVEDVAGATRIRATLVRAIESGDFSRCGGLVYARGHVKSIARVVGADVSAVLAEFDRSQQAADADPGSGTVGAVRPGSQGKAGRPPAGPRAGLSAPSLPNPFPPFEAAGKLGRSGNPSARWASLAIGVLVVVAVILGVSWVAGMRQSSGPNAGASPGRPSAVVTTAATVPRSTPTPARTTASPSPTPSAAARGVTLRVRASAGDSWLLVTSSGGGQVFQGVLASGQVQEFRDDRQLTVKFGNSHAVTLTLNGRDVGAPSCGTIVCSQQFTSVSAG